MFKLNIILSEESSFFRQKVIRNFESDSRVNIIGTDVEPPQILKKIRESNVDVVVLSVTLMADLTDLITEIVDSLSVPVLLLTTNKGLEGTQIMKYLQLGAFDYVVRPSDPSDTSGIETMLVQLGMRLKNAASSRLESFNKSLRECRISPGVDKDRSSEEYLSRAPKLLAFGASTGGPAVLVKIMSEFPAGLPVPIVIAQHMIPDFMNLFTDEIRKKSKLRVRTAVHGTPLENGTITVAPGGKHMTVIKSGDSYLAVVRDNTEGLINCPSVDILFNSVAQYVGERACGILLTGMGDDGAAGLKQILRMGGTTIAEDRSTALIYGMPAVAIAMGAAKKILPSYEIAPFIKRMYRIRDV